MPQQAQVVYDYSGSNLQNATSGLADAIRKNKDQDIRQNSEARQAAQALDAVLQLHKATREQYEQVRQTVAQRQPEVAAFMTPSDYSKSDSEMTTDNLNKATLDRSKNPENITPATSDAIGFQNATGAAIPAKVTEVNRLRNVIAPPAGYTPKPAEVSAARVETGLDQSANSMATVGESTRHNKVEEGQTGPLRVAQTGAAQASGRAHDAAALASKGADADTTDIANAIIEGKQPPDTARMYGKSVAVKAKLARAGYDLTSATQDWQATTKHISTLNGPQQTRLRQAVDAASAQVDNVEKLYGEWKAAGVTSGVNAFNKASLAASKALPGAAGAAARALEGQIALATGEFGQVLMGGNSPTDHSLTLAAKMLQGDWNEQQFGAAIKQLRTDLKIRQNSLANSTAAGTGATNAYAPKDAAGGKTVTRAELERMGATAEEAAAEGYTVVDH